MTANVYAISNQVQDMFMAGGFVESEDIHDFINMTKRARRICIEACHDTGHPSVRQIDKVLHSAISMV